MKAIYEFEVGMAIAKRENHWWGVLGWLRYDLRVMGSSPRSGSALSAESACLCPFLSVPPLRRICAVSLSLLKNKYKILKSDYIFKNHWWQLRWGQWVHLCSFSFCCTHNALCLWSLSAPFQGCHCLWEASLNAPSHSWASGLYLP